MTLALICAMPMELRPLARKLKLRRDAIGGVDVRKGRLDGREVVAVATGMGTTLATRSTERLVAAVDVDAVIVFGITGAVDDATSIGTLIVPEVVIHAETGSEHRPAPLRDHVAHGAMWTTNVITPASELPGLIARGVVSLDMETAAIAAVCEQRGIPWSVVRAISDRATDGSVDEEVFKLSNQDGSPNLGRVFRYFLKHPGAMPRLAKLGKGAKVATNRAADAAIAAAR